MKLPLPLYARISGWFLLNLLLVGGVVYFFSKQYLQLDNIIAGPAGERITTLAKLTGETLRQHDETDWPDQLEPLEKQHNLKFHTLFRNGELMHNADLALPDTVTKRLGEIKIPQPPPDRRRPGPRGNPGTRDNLHDAPPAPPDQFDRTGRPFRRGGTPDPPLNRRPLRTAAPSLPSAPVHAQVLFAVKDEHGDYWYANLLTLGPPSTGVRHPHAVILLIKSTTLGADGLILDTSPWWKLGGLIIAISILLWIPFAWNLTRYIRRLTRRTISIARGNFEANQISHRGDELGRLGMAIDRLRQRLSGYVDGQKRFTSDIAHELCTPLARMQLSLGVLEQQNVASPETINDLRDEVRQMSGMVDELLDFSRASISPDKVTLEKINIHELATEVIDREGATTAQLDIRPETTAMASHHLLRRALGNVLRNATHYAPGKNILIHTSSSDRQSGHSHRRRRPRYP